MLVTDSSRLLQIFEHASTFALWSIFAVSRPLRTEQKKRLKRTDRLGFIHFAKRFAFLRVWEEIIVREDFPVQRRCSPVICSFF